MKNDQVKVIVLRAAGTNCNEETAFAFHYFGAQVEQVHVNRLMNQEKTLEDYHILALPGGFSYGDDIASGKILANELRLRLGDDIRRFIDEGKLIIGICNGFQTLAKAGILPGFRDAAFAGGFIDLSTTKSKEVVNTAFSSREERSNTSLPSVFGREKASRQDATLTYNDSGKFEDRWIHLKPSGRCVWTEGIKDAIFLPVAHGEGKFVPRDEAVLKRLKDNGQIIFRYLTPDGRKGAYPQNPNGSVDDIAGICDETGRVFGLMPHPERHFRMTQHPYWTRLKGGAGRALPLLGDGAKIFENGIEYVKKHVLCKEDQLVRSG